MITNGTNARRDMLAKLLAKENITIQQGNYETAFFDVENRILGLPMWTNVSDDVWTMLSGHEVGHALFTPLDGLKSSTSIPTVYLNVVEDVRIERLVQETYPGLAVNFRRGYAELHSNDFFGIKGKDVNSLPIADRINLKAKLGSLIEIDFTADEQKIFDQIKSAQTWDEVVAAAKVLMGANRAEAKQKADGGQSKPDPKKTSDKKDRAQSSEQGQESVGPAGDPELNSDKNEESEDSSENKSSGKTNAQDDSDSDDSSESDSSDGVDTDSGDEAGEGKSSKNDSSGNAESDGEESKDANATKQKAASTTGESKPEISNSDLDKVSTQQDFDKAAKTLRDTSKEAMRSVRITAPSREACLENVLSYKDLRKLRDENLVRVSGSRTRWPNFSAYLRGLQTRNGNIWSDFQKFLSDAKPIVRSMAKEFELRKKAHQYSRATTSRTGSLDCNRLHSYKTSDDIFLSVTNLANAKNHGMVMFLDYSGSMNTCLPNVIHQTINLVLFCRACNIPFRVYSFTDDHSGRTKKFPFTAMHHNLHGEWVANHFPTDCLPVSNTMVVELLSSEMKRDEYTDALFTLFARSISGTHFDARVDQLGNTPLNETVIIAHHVVADFRARHKVEKVTSVFLTDGEGHAPTMILSPKFHAVRGLKIAGYSDVPQNAGVPWQVNNSSTTGIVATMNLCGRDVEIRYGGYGTDGARRATIDLLQNLRITQNTETVGFFLGNRYRSGQEIARALGFKVDSKLGRVVSSETINPYSSSDNSKFLASLKDDGVVVMPNTAGYGTYFVMEETAIAEDNAATARWGTVDSKQVSGRVLAREFSRLTSSKKGNRVFTTKFAEAIS